MPLILHIDSATDIASVALSENGKECSKRVCIGQKDQGAFIQPTVQALLNETKHSIHSLSAVSVTIGPGSYTGLRVGLASAKGICYALNLPLITMTTTEVMTSAAIPVAQHLYPNSGPFLFCPMIDARRMEVFMALYDQSVQCIIEPFAKILDSETDILESYELPVFFFGSGASKYKSICYRPRACFGDVTWDAGTMIGLATARYEAQQFTSVEHSVPFYVKPFYTQPARNQR